MGVLIWVEGVSGGGGNRTRVLQRLNGPSPSAAGGLASGSPFAAGGCGALSQLDVLAGRLASTGE
jgi:hypothetical protein